VALADDGREQARRLATRLRSQPIAAIYASPLQRCADTARLLAEPHDLAAFLTAVLLITWFESEAPKQLYSPVAFGQC